MKNQYRWYEDIFDSVSYFSCYMTNNQILVNTMTATDGYEYIYFTERLFTVMDTLLW